VILGLLFLALLIALLSRRPIPPVMRIGNVADLLLDVASRAARAVFATLWLLVVRSIVLDRYYDSR
jgi:hypothetical protein